MNISNGIKLVVAGSLSIVLASCGNVTSSEVIADSVSGYEYNNMTCKELEGEMDHLERAGSAAAGVVDSRKNTQDGKNAAAFLFFWPALFLTDDNSSEANKYARIKGEFDAAQRAYRRKDC